jgi:hypothetical protein
MPYLRIRVRSVLELRLRRCAAQLFPSMRQLVFWIRTGKEEKRHNHAPFLPDLPDRRRLFSLDDEV